MKLIICVVLGVALAQATQLKPAHVKPLFPPRRPSNFKPGVRITGGDEVVPHSLPYQVGLLIPTEEGTAFCGGSLLSPTTVLTAAHCGELATTIEIVLGAHKIREEEPEQIRVNSSEVIVHPDWNRLLLQNDLAILRIADGVELNENINTVPLPSRADAEKDYLDDLATASGWGKDSDAAETISDVLRSVQIPVGENGVCNLYYFGVIQDTHLCAHGDDGKSTCSGDSGGPLVASTGELIGVTSFGISFGCEIGWPSVYTRVTKYLDWIAENSDVVIN
ncbi:brachyurin [Tribolium castaneum]|uniref:Serine protease P96 n=1 Tax=Tribolium castaneum TaxID=7070 RepID=D6WSY4_TRICA|nr:PREDICTED: brachyurin [Tribolium castaneum]EFA07506.2 serine protease P96 [Tribolium castaneum]|eukprot:XP_969640.1 PREDICTED: brachyurin [Tribolium castaneum]